MSDVEVVVVPPVRVPDWEAFVVPEGYRAEVIQGDYLEIDLTTATPIVVRYELRRRTLVEVDRATSTAVLRADRPFSYEIRPLGLIE